MNKLNDFGLLIFRVVIGSFMLFGHGLGKFSRLINGSEIKFYDPFGFGDTVSFILIVSAEFFAAALIILGLFTRLSSLFLVIAMSVAGFIYHADDPFGTKEKALMYLVSFLLLFLLGPGRYGLQSLITKNIEKFNGIWRFLLS